MTTKAKQAVKLLRVGAGVSGEYGQHHTISGYIGHDWTDDVDADTIGLDIRPVEKGKRITLAISGPMCNPDLPPKTMDKTFAGGWVPYVPGQARSLDYVSLDVYLAMWEEAGAIVHRGEEAVRQFAASISRRS